MSNSKTRENVFNYETLIKTYQNNIYLIFKILFNYLT